MNSSVLEDTGVLPSLVVSLSLGCLLFLSRAIFDPPLISRSLSLARARSLLLEGSSTFVPSRTPLASQPAGMVSCSHPLSSSLPISGSLSLSLSLSLTLPGLPAAGFARRAPHSRLCSAAPAPQAVQRCSVTRLWHRGPAKPISRSARFSARLLHGLGKEALEGLHQILGGPLLHKPPNAGRQPHRLQLAQGRHPG